MKIHLLIILLIVASFNAFGQDASTSGTGKGVNKWKFGVALWTFHTVNFQDALAKVDSAGITYIEPNTFHKAGPALNDSLMLQLSPGGMAKLRKMIDQRRLQAESVYIVGDKTVNSWKKQFEIAKQLGAKFVTAEPPVNLWDEIDSLAGIYGMKVAIHEHWKGVSQYWHPDSVLAALKNHPNFGACADLGHWPKSGINPVDALKKLKGHVIGVHLKDIAAYNDPSLKDVPVGTGVLDFPAIFQELKRQNFNGPIYVERDAEDKPSNLPSVRQTKKYYYEQINRLK
ncbi:TIM barrel protein [Spirosoma sp. HMF4905]|uniref:TIM barrel protein n=1 Tax=Spirosoma arboris TaxID=2682092 RepID=A0A7K1SIV2_9BACT|nr:sugar phosphate isomerase/epimerase family protein [Spirosoma arboris]MVM33751.1 TIM barrel protein [Spirosoma arboris]